MSIGEDNTHPSETKVDRIAVGQDDLFALEQLEPRILLSAVDPVAGIDHFDSDFGTALAVEEIVLESVCGESSPLVGMRHESKAFEYDAMDEGLYEMDSSEGTGKDSEREGESAGIPGADHTSDAGTASDTDENEVAPVPRDSSEVGQQSEEAASGDELAAGSEETISRNDLVPNELGLGDPMVAHMMESLYASNGPPVTPSDASHPYVFDFLANKTSGTACAVLAGISAVESSDSAGCHNDPNLKAAHSAVDLNNSTGEL